MLKKYFMSGLKAFIPIAVTFAIVIWVFSSIEAFFGKILQWFIPEGYYVNGLGILVGIILVFVLGILINAWILKQIYQIADGIVKKIPFIKTIYGSVQDLLEFFEKTQDTQHNQAVVVRFGKMRFLGFVTRESFDGLPEALGGEKDILVYIPMSYNIAGMMMSVPRKMVVPVDLKVNQAMSFILTAGMSGIKPESLKEIESDKQTK